MSTVCYYLCSVRKSECISHIATFIKKLYIDVVLLVYILYVAQMYNIFLLFFTIKQQIKCTFNTSDLLIYMSICIDKSA